LVAGRHQEEQGENNANQERSREALTRIAPRLSRGKKGPARKTEKRLKREGSSGSLRIVIFEEREDPMRIANPWSMRKKKKA